MADLVLYKNIKKRRMELGMTQTELAKKTGYSDKSMIAKVEAGLIDLPQSKIKAFADALKLSPAQLMGWSEIPDYQNYKSILFKAVAAIEELESVDGKSPSDSSDSGKYSISPFEYQIILAYRKSNKGIQDSIVKLLDLEDTQKRAISDA